MKCRDKQKVSKYLSIPLHNSVMFYNLNMQQQFWSKNNVSKDGKQTAFNQIYFSVNNKIMFSTSEYLFLSKYSFC